MAGDSHAPTDVVPIISSVIGWIYVLAWSISFYPQVILNYRRKTVDGYSLDYLSLNILGFTCYAMFNCAIYWNDNVQQEYFALYPGKEVIPVDLTDVVFSLHAIVLTVITIAQTCYYPKGKSKLTWLGTYLAGIGWAGLVIGMFVVLIFKDVNWIMYLNFAAAIKVAVTLIKYSPQLYMNYSRKSTIGWSIHNILLDFTGGFGSITQQVINSIYYHEASILFGDVPKLALGLISMFFDVLFMIQHYVLYKDSNTDLGKTRTVTLDSSDEGSGEAGSGGSGGGDGNSTGVQIATGDAEERGAHLSLLQNRVPA